MTVRRVVTFTAIAVLAVAATLAGQGRHLIKQIPVPGDYGWDYASADTEGRRLYVGHVKEVTVLDLDTGAVVGSVGGGTNMHGAAVARPFNRGFISQTNPESGSVVIFDLKTLARIGEVTVGKDPNLILCDRRLDASSPPIAVTRVSARSMRRPECWLARSRISAVERSTAPPMRRATSS
jgi:DNA-binding beta-propeller fold protein YncE